ncbi:molybdenum cofactor cytidylyltransferase [Photobacterium profundum]|uniref:Hypothetical ygfJ n=1 Tax=Photobacterium profundum 3TCK TaxID=314280 RepID=Q1Z971_9GAMM|nr:molybdenum cofactor cytidylyltransferase [Photobacterium profundum]EAS44887.1 hypothetical ygfJ [Photobacterium profundum 3TCK]
MTMKQKHLDCVMPAAGLSSRMGDWKLMLPYRQHTILDESIENALHFCSRVIVVAGHRHEELVRHYCHHDNVLVVVNPHYQQGMFSSIQVGIEHVESEHFFICHGDMPCIPANIYQQVWALKGQCTVFPGTLNKPGHPVLLPKNMINIIKNAPITSKMKPLIMAHTVKYLGLKCDEIYLDIDTPDAYQSLIKTQ